RAAQRHRFEHSGDSGRLSVMPLAQKPNLPSAQHGVFLETRTIVGGAVALLGVGMLALFMWMVPSAATREVHAACAGLKSKSPNASSQDERARGLAQVLCRPNQPCQYPLLAP